ncbi:ATP-binding cassette sub-family C member 12 [Anabrus simplex]|uniref:ATP-binding cassette sub-family C member 12 n=1 Tax=Anabrus simplex TaxID=316456 RepID=UPI0035A3754E
MLNPDDIRGEYVRLRADSPAGSLDTQDALPSTSHHVGIHLPTTSPSIHYIPKKSGKYRAAWRTLIPFRKTKRAVYEVPLDKLGLFSYITCTWMTTFLHKSWNPSFSEQEIVIGASTDSSDINGQRFKLLLSDEIVKSGVLNSSLCHVVWLFIRTRIIIACVLSLLGSFFSIIGLVLFLYPYFLTFREQIDSRERSTDWISPLIFIFSQVIAVFLQSWSTNLTYRTAVRLRSAFLSVMYRHLVRVSVLSSLSVQQIVTVMATDSQRLFHAVTCVPSVITAPLIFIICSIILMWSYTASLIQSPSCGMEHLRIAAVNIVASLFIFPLMYLLAKAASVFKSRATNSASDRLTKLHEMLSHIRLVKIASWEKFFLSKVKDFRRMECEFGRKAHVVDSFGVSLYHTAPVITALLLCYVNSTSALYIMVLILLLVPMKDSLLKFWDSVSGISSAQASLERLRNVLLLDKSKQSTEKPMNRLVAVAVSNANFVLKSNNVLCNQYDNENCFSCRKCSTRSYELEKDEELEMQDKTLLTNISFSAPKGKLIGICGARGSGKTTLLLAILGHLNLGYGKVFRDGMFSYVSQNPWIWDATLRDNILFNEIFNHKRYYQAIHCCSLNDDIQHLPGGDQTKLHGKSLSLSQRQRVAVARALYACRDICLFDNFLSALDERMASDIFEKAILTHLREKTVIITSQNEEFLSHCDEIYLLEDGEITDRGSYEDLLSTAGNRFTDLLEHHSGELSVKNCQGPKHFPLFSNSVMNVPSVMAEDEDRGQTDSLQMAKFSSNILLAYAKSSQIFLPIVNSATLGIAFIILVLTSVVVCAWIKGDSSDQEFNPHMNWIPSVIVLILITSISGSIIFYKVLEKVLLIIHNTWLEKICSTSITFFQETWVSDIMKWFSLYLQTIDTYLPTGAANVMLQLTFVPLSILIIIMTSAWFLIPVFVIAILSFLLCHIFKPGLIKLQSLEEESSSPMYTFVASSLAGRATIQAYGKENDYLAMFVKLCDVNATCTQLVSGAICWFNFRIQMISALGTTLILSLIVTAHTFNFQDFLFVHSPLWETVSQVGATMLFVLILGNTFQGALQSTMILITKFSSVGQLDARICVSNVLMVVINT